MQSAEVVLGVLRERGRQGLPCEQLYRQMFNKDLYLLAYGNIYSNSGAMTPGASEETADGMSEEKIEQIVEAMRCERYRFAPARRTYSPKKNGKLRPLGLPSWSDKLVGEVVRLLLEAYYEPGFSDLSHGFRKRRGCHTALRKIHDTWTGTVWFIEGDISDCLDAWSHCSFRSLSWSEQPVLEGWRFDTQAFPASGADVHGAEPSVLDTLHDGLAGDAVGEGGFEHGEPAVRGVVDEQGADFGGEAEPAAGAGGELLAADEPVVEPPVQRGRGEAEFGGGVSHGEQFSFLRVVAWLVAGDAPVVPQALDFTGGI